MVMMKFMMNKKVYIYFLIGDNDIRYVGKTNNVIKRLTSHIYTSRKQNKTHKQRWINKLLKENKKIKLEIIDEVCESEWEFWETYWICQFKSWGFNLLNQTNGGDGGDVYSKMPKEQKEKFAEKISKLHKGKKRSKKTKENIKNAKIGSKNPMYGREISNNTKEKLSNSKKKYYEINDNINKGKK